jgi:uncharacterized membrane protein
MAQSTRTLQGQRRHAFDPIWHVQAAVILALVLQLVLPDQFVAGPRAVLPLLEALLLLALVLSTPRLPVFESKVRRAMSVALIALVSLANVYALARVAEQLLSGGRISNGRELILAALNIYLTNLIAFGLWYWEMDGGGPGRRRARKAGERDFLFPQMTAPELGSGWHPTFIDYLYVSATNAMAFSPTDTLPLTRRAKMLMLLQSTVSLTALALVAARAVNILS